MADDRLRSAVAAAALADEEVHGELLQSIVEVARSLFAAEAASILLLDEEANELVFEAVAGKGSRELLGDRFPAGEGVAGWVVTARQPLILDDVSEDPRFSREIAEGTGFVPHALMAVPLLRGDRALGVLSVLDRSESSLGGLEATELLELFANQASIALQIVEQAREARRVLADAGDLALLARTASALQGLEGANRDAGLRLIGALEDLFSQRSSR